MATRFTRCPLCYFRLAVADDADIEFDLEMHRLSGNCRAHEAPKQRAPRKDKKRLDDWMGWDF